MAERQEENGDSNSAATGYICLDQARALALQYAQDHREFYGTIPNKNSLGMPSVLMKQSTASKSGSHFAR